MNDKEKERYINRILSGSIRCKLEGKAVYISMSSFTDKLEGNEIYSECLSEAELNGVFTEDQVISEMISAGLWSHEEDRQMESLPEQLEDLKVGLFKSDGNDKLQEGIRKKLKEKKDEFYSLVQKRSDFTKHTSSGLSETIESQYLLYTSVVDRSGNFLFDGENFWDEDLKIIDSIYSQYISSFIREADLREIARTDPWRSIWNASKSENSLFGVPASRLNKDQKALVNWSRFYDSVNESPEAPADRVIKDDDMLDGWVISQSRKREKDKFRRDMEEKANKHSGAGEIGIPVGSDRMARQVDDLNNPMAKRKIEGIKKTTRELREAGRTTSIDEQKIGVVKREIQMQAVQESRKGGK